MTTALFVGMLVLFDNSFSVLHYISMNMYLNADLLDLAVNRLQLYLFHQACLRCLRNPPQVKRGKYRAAARKQVGYLENLNFCNRWVMYHWSPYTYYAP